MLTGAMARDRVAASYLFAGEEGIGKRLTALNFAKALNCAAPVALGGGGHDACDRCASCVKMDAGAHPDLTVVEADGPMIKVDAIRALEETLSFRSLEGGMKAVIIDNAERMNAEAANAFLKTLEEPAPGTLIVLVSSAPDRLPLTIRSRCSRVNFRPLPPEGCRAVIGDRVGQVTAVVRLAMGRPGLALGDDLLKRREAFLEALAEISRPGTRPTWKDRADVEAWLDQAMVLLRDMAVYKVTGNAAGMVNTDMAGEVARMCGPADLKGLLACYDEMRTLKARQVFNVNKGIVWNHLAGVLSQGGVSV